MRAPCPCSVSVELGFAARFVAILPLECAEESERVDASIWSRIHAPMSSRYRCQGMPDCAASSRDHQGDQQGSSKDRPTPVQPVAALTLACDQRQGTARLRVALSHAPTYLLPGYQVPCTCCSKMTAKIVPQCHGEPGNSKLITYRGFGRRNRNEQKNKGDNPKCKALHNWEGFFVRAD